MIYSLYLFYVGRRSLLFIVSLDVEGSMPFCEMADTPFIIQGDVILTWQFVDIAPYFPLHTCTRQGRHSTNHIDHWPACNHDHHMTAVISLCLLQPPHWCKPSGRLTDCVTVIIKSLDGKYLYLFYNEDVMCLQISHLPVYDPQQS